MVDNVEDYRKVTNWRTYYTPLAKVVYIDIESDGKIIGSFEFPVDLAGALGRNWKQFDNLNKK